MISSFQSGSFSKGISLGCLILIPVLVLMCGFASSPVYGAKVTYTEDDTDFKNPERGFWHGTVVRKYLTLTTHGALSKEFLDGLEKTFNGIRASKMKIVPRFSYSNVDAPVPAMLAQIEQLKPIFERHYDVIAVLEAGFIGRWGEWHSSPNVGLKDHELRRQVLFKLLEAMPKERMVAVRYNAYKRSVYNSNEPLTRQEAFSGSNKARTGNHNDCFITNEGDAGSYRPLNALDGWGLGYEAEKTYLNTDNLYVPQDGETCQVGSTTFASCERALADMARMRWDMINDNFNESVLNQWKKQGCYTEISKRLGYRIVLVDGIYDDDVTDGNLDITLQLKNVGFGKIYNPRNVEIVLRNASGGAEHSFKLPVEPRFWSPGTSHTLTFKIGIPEKVSFGNYALFLSLQDPAPKLTGIPEYAIRLANKDVWEPVKGYNSLKHVVKISSYSKDPTTAAKNRDVKGSQTGVFVGESISGDRSVNISFYNSKSTLVRVNVHDLSGRIVNNLVDRQLGSGKHQFTWNRSGHPSGVYFVTIHRDARLDRKQVIVR